jgi:hypothetical protein
MFVLFASFVHLFSVKGDMSAVYRINVYIPKDLPKKYNVRLAMLISVWANIAEYRFFVFTTTTASRTPRITAIMAAYA